MTISSLAHFIVCSTIPWMQVEAQCNSCVCYLWRKCLSRAARVRCTDPILRWILSCTDPAADIDCTLKGLQRHCQCILHLVPSNTLTAGSHENEGRISLLPLVCAPLLIGVASALSLFHDSLHQPSSPFSAAPALPDWSYTSLCTILYFREKRPAHLLCEYCLLWTADVCVRGAWCLGGGRVEGWDGEYFLWKKAFNLFSHMQEGRPHLFSLSIALSDLHILYMRWLLGTREGKIPVWRPWANSLLLLLLLLRFVFGGLFLSQQLRIKWCNLMHNNIMLYVVQTSRRFFIFTGLDNNRWRASSSFFLIKKRGSSFTLTAISAVVPAVVGFMKSAPGPFANAWGNKWHITRGRRERVELRVLLSLCLPRPKGDRPACLSSCQEDIVPCPPR